MQRKLVLYIALIIFLSACYFLFTGSEILGKQLINAIDLPYGTVISWFGLTALPILLYTGFRNICYPNTKVLKFFKKVVEILILLSAVWGIVGFILADNWAYNFSSRDEFRGSEKAATIFWNYTYLMVILPLVVLILYGFYMLLLFFRKKQT